MPELRTPFPVVVNEHVDRIDGPTRDWVQRWGLLNTAEQAGRYYERLMCGYASAATNPELGYAELRLANDWNMWLFLQDDFWGGYPESEELEATALGLLPRLVSVIKRTGLTPNSGEHGLVASFADLWHRTASLASADQLGRLREAAYSTLMAILWEAQVARVSHPIDLSQYRPMRVLSAFPVFVLRLEEILGGYGIPVTQIRDHRVERLVWLSAATTCWLNDVISYPKEIMTERSNGFSIPEILRRQSGSSPQQALDAAEAAFYQSIEDYQRQEEEVLAFADPELRRYIGSATRPFISGWTDWAYRTARYGVGMPLDAAPLSLSTTAVDRGL
ncbi:hypothetical protein [Kutzneria buriramensis]|nr:hypothetical protein [Kutzneria buriramensis]